MSLQKSSALLSIQVITNTELLYWKFSMYLLKNYMFMQLHQLVGVCIWLLQKDVKIYLLVLQNCLLMMLNYQMLWKLMTACLVAKEMDIHHYT